MAEKAGKSRAKEAWLAVKVIAVIVLVIASISGYIQSRRRELIKKQRAAEAAMEPLGPGEIWLTSEDSREINLGVLRGRSIIWKAQRKDVPFYVIINGGKSEGGDEYPTPPSRDWELLGWKPKFFGDGYDSDIDIYRVRFRLLPCKHQTAKLEFEITQR
jgi:hypothetical protein